MVIKPELTLMRALLRRADADAVVRGYSAEDIAEAVGYSARHCQRLMRKLESLGVIVFRWRRGRGRGQGQDIQSYQINHDVWLRLGPGLGGVH